MRMKSKPCLSAIALRAKLIFALSTGIAMGGQNSLSWAQAPACEACQQNFAASPGCIACGTTHSPRHKPFSVLKLGSLIEGMDRATDSLERSLLGGQSANKRANCDACDQAQMSSQPIWQTYSSHKSEPTGPNPQAAANVPPANSDHQQFIKTVTPESEPEKLSPPANMPDALPSSALPALTVPPSLPTEDYQRDPFRDDARSKPVPSKLNRYMLDEHTSPRMLSSAPVQASSSRSHKEQNQQRSGHKHTSHPAEPPKPTYSRAYPPEAFIEQQKLAEVAAKNQIESNRKPLAAKTEQIVAQRGIRIKVNESTAVPATTSRSLPEAHRAVYEATLVEPHPLVRPAAAIELAR